MTTKKNLGIWMDHANAHLIEFLKDTSETRTIVSKFTHQEKEHSLGKSEHLMHNQENHQQSEYYKNLAGIIINYENVILFGPTNAKTELFNIIKADHHFGKIKIGVRQADKMTENQQFAFVKEYFQNDETLKN
jgi:hypothetical protein